GACAVKIGCSGKSTFTAFSMETPLTTQPDTSRETCLGFPFVDDRAITENERMMLQKQAKQSMQRGFAWGCGAPVLFYLLLDIVVLLIVYLDPALKNNPANLKIYPAVVVGISGIFIVG